MKKIFLFLTLMTFSCCYFGMNESSGKIIRDFYLISWDENFWQISQAKNSSEFNPENIVIKHDVFGVGHNENFIIAIQHPCEKIQPHLKDYNTTLQPNKKVTNYYIIELLANEAYRINKFDSETKYLKARVKLGVPEDLEYQFYKESLE